MNVNCYLSHSHFVIACHLKDFRTQKVSGTALVQGICIQFFFSERIFWIFLTWCFVSPDRLVKIQTASENTYILIDILMCSIAENFYKLKLCRILTSPWGGSKYKQLVKILTNCNTSHQKCLISFVIQLFSAKSFYSFLIRRENKADREAQPTIKQIFLQ